MTDRPSLSSNDAGSAASRLAHEIRRLRKAREWSQPQLATAISYTRQYVSLAERVGQNLPSRVLVTALDKALGANGVLMHLRELAETEQRSRRLVQTTPQGAADFEDTVAESQIAELTRMCEIARGADHVELASLRAKFAELCAWLYQDLGNFAVTDRALDWSYLAQDAELATIVLARKSQLACDQRDPESAIGIGSYAVSTTSNQKLAAAANTYVAHGYALSGDRPAAERLYERARELVSSVSQESRWGGWLDHSYIEVHRAQSLTELGDLRNAADAFDLAISGLPDGYHRDKGVYLARSARAHAGAGDVAHAAKVGARSVAIAIDTRSGRTISDAYAVGC